jgi:predicted enzyme related to lactoylglutathione lyase
MSDRKTIPGKFSWFEHVSPDPRKAQAFYTEVLGWRIQPFPMGGFTYDMLYAGDTMIGGFQPPKNDRPAHWIGYVSVADVDAAAKVAVVQGGRVVDAPHDIANVGRIARIADAQGAELSLFRSATGDPPDETGEGVPGRWLWHELHTTDPASALAFYAKVASFTSEAMNTGPGGTYHVLSSAGVGRGGVTSQLDPGTPPHWLPYVHVADVDDVAARAARSGGRVAAAPYDIPGVGRVAVLKDPTGGTLAVMKPQPRARSH